MAYTVKTKDPIVIEIIKKIDERSLIGQEKYGDTMMSEAQSGKKDLRRFMIDVQEEMTDMLLYMESARHCLQMEIEECYIRDKNEEPIPPCSGHAYQMELEDEINERMNIIGQNGNDGLHYCCEDASKCEEDCKIEWDENNHTNYWVANQT